MQLIDQKLLEVFVGEVLKEVGLEDFSLSAVCEGLINASLRGVDSHGVRLLPHYAESARSGRKNPCPSFLIEKHFSSALAINADNAFGLAAGRKAVMEGMKVAAKMGVCIVSVSNSSHPGAMASIVIPAAEAGFCCFGFTNADALVIPPGGTRPFFGTNPICFAAPRRTSAPFCIDMSVSEIPWNQVLLHKINQTSLPSGCVADQEGSVTIDPAKAASLFGIGNYKGHALAAMVEVLCGVIAGSIFGREIPAMYQAPMSEGRNLSQCYIIFRPDIAAPLDTYYSTMDRLTEAVQDERVKANSGFSKIYLPNDPQIEIENFRRANGIPIDAGTLQSLLDLKKSLSIQADFG